MATEHEKCGIPFIYSLRIDILVFTIFYLHPVFPRFLLPRRCLCIVSDSITGLLIRHFLAVPVTICILDLQTVFAVTHCYRFTCSANTLNLQTIVLQTGVGCHSRYIPSVGICSSNNPKDNLIFSINLRASCIRNRIVLLSCTSYHNKRCPCVSIVILSDAILDFRPYTGGCTSIVHTYIQATNCNLQIVCIITGFLDIECQRSIFQITMHVYLVVGTHNQVIINAIDHIACIGISFSICTKQILRPSNCSGRHLHSSFALYLRSSSHAITNQISQFSKGNILLIFVVILLVMITLSSLAQRVIDSQTIQIEVTGNNRIFPVRTLFCIIVPGRSTINKDTVSTICEIIHSNNWHLINLFITAIVAVIKLVDYRYSPYDSARFICYRHYNGSIVLCLCTRQQLKSRTLELKLREIISVVNLDYMDTTTTHIRISRILISSILTVILTLIYALGLTRAGTDCCELVLSFCYLGLRQLVILNGREIIFIVDNRSRKDGCFLIHLCFSINIDRAQTGRCLQVLIVYCNRSPKMIDILQEISGGKCHLFLALLATVRSNNEGNIF